MFLALSPILIMCGIFQYYIPNLKLSSIFELDICEGRFSNWLTHILYFIRIYILCSFQHVCLEDAHFSEGEL